MLCQNCGKNEATTHLRRIINGETAEMHLCPSCSAAMGYSMGFSPFGLGLGGLLGGMFSDFSQNIIGARVSVCEKCGLSFEDIVRNGKVGCDECYSFFNDKLSASVEKIHLGAVYCGKHPKNEINANSELNIIDNLKKRLELAVEKQDFESAARLRDEIKIREKLNNEMV